MSTAASALPPAWGEGDSLARVLEKIEGKRRQLPGGDWLAQCANSAHEDRNPSMQVTWVRTEHGGRTLLRCYGCGSSAISQEEWAHHLGLDYDDLFDDRRWTLHNQHGKGKRHREYKSSGARRSGATYSKLGKLPKPIARTVHELTGEPAPMAPVEQDEACSHRWEPVEDYEYVDAEGTLVQVVRRQRCSKPGCGAKNFPSQWPTRDGQGWFDRKKDAAEAGVSTAPVLYRLPDVLAAAGDGGQVWLLEGEKDVHAAEALGLVATTNPGGSNNFPDELAAPFAGAHVCLVLDRDPAGWMRGFRVPPLLMDAGAASVRIFLPATTTPKSDFSDHLAAGHDLDALIEVPAPAVRAWVGLREVETHLVTLGSCEAEAEAQLKVADVDRKAGRKDQAAQRRSDASRWAKEATRVHEKLIATVHLIRDQAQQVPECDWAQEALEVALSSARSATHLVAALFTLLEEASPRSLHQALEELVVAAQSTAQPGTVGAVAGAAGPQVAGSSALAPAGGGASGGGRGWDPKIVPGGGEGGGGASGGGIRRVVRISAPHYDVVLDEKTGRLELVEIKQQASSRRRGEEDVELEQVFTRLLNCEVRLVRREFAEVDDEIDDDLVDLYSLGDRDRSQDKAQALALQTYAVIDVRAEIQDEPMRVKIPFDNYVDGSFVPHLKVAGLDFLGSRSGKEKIVSAINAVSAAAEIVTSYRATGWRNINGQDVYITSGGAIGPQGWTQVVSDLTGPLARYDLPVPCADDPARLREAFLDHSAGLMSSFPDRIGAALLGTAYRAVLSPNEWVTVLTASPGVGKTGLASLTMHHFGELWDRNRPLTSLSGNGATANALRILAHRCKDALMYLDDNAPTTGLEAAYKRLEEIIRMIHNAEDRARANRTGDEVSSGGRPRTSALMTSEVPPRAGTSGERRALMVPLTRDEVSIDAIRALDTLSSRHARALLMSSFLQWIARRGRASALDRAAQLRVEFGDWLRTHPRSGPIHQRHGDKITELWVGWALMLDFLGQTQALTAEETSSWRTRVADALVVAAETCEDPDMVTSTGQRVCELLRYAMANNMAYAADITDGALAPAGLESRTGWMAQVRHEDSIPVTTWRRSERAIHLGYVNTDVHRADDCSAELVCTKSGLEATLKAAAAQMTDTSTLDLGTALRALAEEGVLKTAQVENPGGGTTVRRLINRTIPAEQDTQGRPARGKRVVLRLDALLDDDQDGGPEDENTPPPVPGPGSGWSNPTTGDEGTGPEESQDPEADDDLDPQEQEEPMAGFVHTNVGGLSLESHPMSRGECARPGCYLPAAVGFAGVRLHLPCYEATTVATVTELHQLIAQQPAPVPATDPQRTGQQDQLEVGQPTPDESLPQATAQSQDTAPRPDRTAGTTAAPFVASAVVVDVDGYYLPGQPKAPLPFPISHAGHLEQLGRDLRIGTAPMRWRKYPEAGLVVPTTALWEQLGVPTDVPARASKRKTWFEEVSVGLAFLTDAAADGWIFGRGEGDPVLRGMTRLRRHDAPRGTASIMYTPGMPTDWGLGPDLDPASIATRLQLFTDAIGMPFHASPISTGLDLLRILMPREVREQLTAAHAVDYEGVTPAWNPECEPSFDWTRTPTPDEAQSPCLALFDRGGSYLSTWSSLKIGVGAPEHHGTELGFDAARAGWWLIQLPERAEGDQMPYPDLLDPAGNRAGQQVWVTTPALEYATGTGLDLQVEVLESWSWPPQRSKAWLSGLYKVLRDGLAHLRDIEGQDAAAVAGLVKQIYKQLSGHFISTDSDTRERPELRGREDVLDMHHPYAFHAMRAKARVAILHQVLKVGQASGTWPLVVSNNDLIGYAADQVQDPTAAWPGEASKLTTALGGYKLDRWAPMDAQVPHLRTGRGWGGLDDTRRRGEQW